MPVGGACPSNYSTQLRITVRVFRIRNKDMTHLAARVDCQQATAVSILSGLLADT